MSVKSPWESHYRVLPDGRAVLSHADLRALETQYWGRIVETELSGRSARVYLLDAPRQIDDRMIDANSDLLHLSRIRIRELPNWPPHPALSPELPDLLECRFQGVRFSPRDESQASALEYEIDYRGQRFKAIQAKCPLELMACVVETLNQAGTRGRNLLDIQEMRLMGSG